MKSYSILYGSRIDPFADVIKNVDPNALMENLMDPSKPESLFGLKL